MYYVQKSSHGFYLSPQSEAALFAIDMLPNKLLPKRGFQIVLQIDEAAKEVWYEYKQIMYITADDERDAMLIDLSYEIELLKLGMEV